MFLSLAAYGCAPDDPSSAYGRRARKNVPGETADDADRAGEQQKAAKSVNVTGHISSEGNGNTEQGLAGKNVLAQARSIEVFSLSSKGDLTSVTKTDVKPGGAFQVTLNDPQQPAGTGTGTGVGKDATGIFILKVKDLAGAVVGSGVVNGLPAFIQGFAIDAVIDTATSFKAEILTTLAKKGVPGVQNYLNVLNAYVDAQLANSIALVGVLATDLTTIIGATSDAVIAATNVIQEALNKAGIPIDLSAFTNAQSTIVSGIQGLITDSTGKLVSASQGLVAALQAAAAKAAAPIDEAIFNAIINGGAKFGGDMKKSLSGKGAAGGVDLGFAAIKSVFKLEADLATSGIGELFKNAGVRPQILDAVTKACGGFLAQIENATSSADLAAAKAKLNDILLGKNDNNGGGAILKLLSNVVEQIVAVIQNVEATIDPLARNLLAALTSLDPNAINDALGQLESSSPQLLAALKKVVKEDEARVLADAIILVQKAGVP